MTNLPATTQAAALTPFDEIQRMGAAIAKSGLFGIKTPDQAVALMLIAQAEGRHPATVARDYDIIQGRPAKKAEAMLRDFQAAGGSVEWHQRDDKAADATFSPPRGNPVRVTWTVEKEAKAAGLAGKDNWKKFTRAMLHARCVSEGVRATWPAATSGMYVPEEVQDIAAEHAPAKARDVSPAEAFTGAPAREIPTATPQADALLPPAEEKRAKDAWKDDRAIELGWADRRAQTAAVMGYLDDAKGFSITAEWTAPRLKKLGRTTLWGLKPDELAELHQELRDAGDHGERFKSNGKTPPPQPDGPPQFADLPDDGVPF